MRGKELDGGLTHTHTHTKKDLAPRNQLCMINNSERERENKREVE